MKYKALFLDIDDTLLSHHQPVSAGNLAAIRKAQAAGIFVTISTGRTYLGATPVWIALNVRGPVIVFGGAVGMNTLTDQPLFAENVPVELVREALECAKDLGVHAQIYHEDKVIAEKANDFTRLYTARQMLPFVEEPELRGEKCMETPKVLIYALPEQEAAAIRVLRERFSGRLEIASSMPGFIELNKFGSNKGSAMLRVAELLGISQEETAAMGDNTLDLEMVRMAGISACVSNGQQVVKDVADVVAPPCDEDGVAWFIEHYLLEGEK